MEDFCDCATHISTAFQLPDALDQPVNKLVESGDSHMAKRMPRVHKKTGPGDDHSGAGTLTTYQD